MIGKQCVESTVDKQINGVEEQNATVGTERKVLYEVIKFQVVCNKEIQFTPDEVMETKSIQSPGLRLVGFKPLEELKPRRMIKHCLFFISKRKAIDRLNAATSVAMAKMHGKTEICTVLID